MGALARNLGLLVITSSAVALLGGCASISSQKVNPAEFQHHAAEGLVYHLPRRGMRFDVTVAESPKTLQLQAAASTQASRVKSTSEVLETKKEELDLAEARLEDAQKNLGLVARTLTESEKSLAVTVTVVDNAATETVADMRSSYLLRYNKNLVADNNMAVAVNSYGLLSIAHAQSVNRLNDIAAHAAATAVAVSTGIGPGLGGTPPAPVATNFENGFEWTGHSAGPVYAAPMPNSATVVVKKDNAGNCEAGDKFSVVVDPLQVKGEETLLYPTRTVCGVDIILARDFNLDAKPYDERPEASMSWKTVWGVNLVGRATRNVVYYKQNMSYTVGICSAEKDPVGNFVRAPDNTCLRRSYLPDGSLRIDFTDHTSTLKATSPNESPVYHAGISRTIFADNTSDIALHNGVISAVENSGTSEMLGAVRIPTSMLNAGTTAVSGVFSSLQGISKAQNNYVISQTGEKLSERGAVAALAACQAALAKFQLASSESDKAAALTTAKAACPQTAQP